MTKLGDKIKSRRYDGQLDELRKLYNLAIRNLPKEGADTGTMIATAIVFLIIGGMVAYGIWGQ